MYFILLFGVKGELEENTSIHWMIKHFIQDIMISHIQFKAQAQENK